MSRKKFLVPIDFSQDSSELLQYAGSIAENSHGRISCVNVMPEIAHQEDPRNEQQLRRNVELELAKVTTEVFTHKQPEFDIIVTKGDFVQRILGMTKELEINLIITQVTDIKLLSSLHTDVEVPIIILNNKTEKLNELVLPINLDESDYQKIQKSIDVANLLNVQIKVVAFTTLLVNEYKGKLNDIKNMIEKENIACTISFIKPNEKLSVLLEDLEISTSESLLLTFSEFSDIFKDIEEPGYRFISSMTILPSKKKPKLLASVKKQQCYN